MLPESGSLCHVGFDAGSREGCRGNGARRSQHDNQRERERERETAKDKRRLRENPEGENFIVTTIALNLGTLRATLAAAPTHEEFHYKSQVGQAPRGPARSPLVRPSW